VYTYIVFQEEFAILQENIYRLNYIDLTKHTSIQSSMVMEVMALLSFK